MTTADLAPGAVFARDYTIVRPLSEGGMGAVYVVQQISTGAQRALKLMHPQLVQDPKLRQRFEQEARIGARIESEHVVQVLGAGVDEPTGKPWLVMELLQGRDLSSLLDERGALPLAEVRDIFAQLTHAIAAAHRVGVVHRDLKPENVFVAVSRREGSEHAVKVLDFGIAKVVAEAKGTGTQALGTPMWMAPEQTDRKSVITPAADVWALGLIAFRMITGKCFWIAANREESNYTMLLREAVFDPIPSAAERATEFGVAHLLPPGFEAWFGRCVAREPAARFPDAGAAREAFFEAMGRASVVPSSSPLVPSSPQITAPVTTPGFPPGATPVVAAQTQPVVAAQTQPVAPPHTPAPAPAPRAHGGAGSGKALWIALLAAAAIGGGLGIRAYVRAQKASTCESGKGDDLLAACRAACDVDPKKFCVIHGDLARTGLDKDARTDAAKSYEKGCSAGETLGCRKHGALQELDGDEAAALASYQKSCDGKDASGCAWLGKRLERGRGVARDAARAASYYAAACNGDDPASCALLAWSGENRPIPRPEAAERDAQFKKAAPALQKECASGGLHECAALGAMLQSGKGVERDPTGANTMLRKACDHGLREACVSAAALTVAEAAADADKAVASLRELCTAGVPAACNDLAVLQAHVPFTLRQEQGVSLFKLACSDAVPFGCTQSAAPIQPPATLAKDVSGAAAMLEKACEGGLGVACANLGAMLESGLGGARNPEKAFASYKKACAAGAPDGCATLEEIPFKAGESWVGTYVCGQGSTDLVLRIMDATPGGRVDAIFDFDYAHGKTAGRFLLSGHYDAGRAAITLAPGIWLEQPNGWMTVGMSGQVSLQKTVFTGKIDTAGCGAFRLVRRVSDMIEPRCDTGARFVEGHGCLPIPRPGPTAVGAWSGRGKEASGSTWLMNATITSLESGRCGQVSYPTLTCGGDWYCTRSSDGKSVRAREIITSGTTRCDSTGFVELTLSDDGQSAEWRWTSPIRPGGSTAHLSRTP